MPTIVVGAGVIGCAIARELAVRGDECVVVDDRPLGGGATQASAGMLAPYVEAHEAGPLLELGVRSLEMYDDWIDAVRQGSGVDVEYRRIGTLEVALDPQHAGELRGQATGDARGERRWIEPADARERIPALATIDGALLTPEICPCAESELPASQ